MSKDDPTQRLEEIDLRRFQGLTLRVGIGKQVILDNGDTAWLEHIGRLAQTGHLENQRVRAGQLRLPLAAPQNYQAQPNVRPMRGDEHEQEFESEY